jgi:hypothetical protein
MVLFLPHVLVISTIFALNVLPSEDLSHPYPELTYITIELAAYNGDESQVKFSHKLMDNWKVALQYLEPLKTYFGGEEILKSIRAFA